MKLTGAFLLLNLVTTLVASFSEAKACLKNDEVESILKDLTIYEWKENGTSLHFKTDKDYLCHEDSIYYKVVSALLYMEQVEKRRHALSPVPSAFQSLVSKEGPLSFFRNRIKNIYFSPTSKERCQEQALAQVFTGEMQSLHICIDKNNFFESDLITSAILVHEARHTDGYPHVKCLYGPYKKLNLKGNGSASCDSDYESQGSYGIGTSYMLDIYSTTESVIEKQMARAEVVIDLFSRFNKLPFDLKEGSLVANTTGKVAFFDGIQSILLWDLNSAIKAVSMQGKQPAFFDSEGSVRHYQFSKTYPFEATAGIVARFYRQKLSPQDYQSLLDIFYKNKNIDYSCFLFPQALVCTNGTESGLFTISLNKIKPHGFIVAENLVTGKFFYYLEDELGNRYHLPSTFQKFQNSSEINLMKAPYSHYKRNTAFQSPSSWNHNLEVFPLNHTYQSFSSIPYPYSPYLLEELNKNIYIRQIKRDNQWIISPFYWSQKIEEL